MNNHVLQIVIFWLPHTRPLIDAVKIVIADSFSTLEFFVHWASILTPSITLILMVLGLLNSSYTWIGPFWRIMRIILCEPCFCYTVVHGQIMIHDLIQLKLGSEALDHDLDWSIFEAIPAKDSRYRFHLYTWLFFRIYNKKI